MSNPVPIWLYVSKRLDLDWWPDGPLFRSPVVLAGGRPFYRLTAGVAVWLEHAADALDRRHQQQPLPVAELAEAVAAFGVVWGFVRERLDPAALRFAREFPPTLPPVPAVPELSGCVPAAGWMAAETARLKAVAAALPVRKRTSPRRRSGERFAAADPALFTRDAG